MEKQWVLITGGTGFLGKSCAEVFASNNYNIILSYLTNDHKAQKLAQELQGKYNVLVKKIKGDISKESVVKGICKRLLKDSINVVCLVNNAAICQDDKLENKTASDFNKVLAVNLVAPFLMGKYIGKMMYNNKKGTIINIASTNGIDTNYPLSMDYDASKAGLISLSNNMAVEFAPYIRVNTIAPGWISTAKNKLMNPNFISTETNKILLKRFALPKEIAEVIFFCASDKASFLNKSIIRVDGGLQC